MLWDRGAVDCEDAEAIELSKPLDEVGDVIGLVVVWLEDEVGEARSF